MSKFQALYVAWLRIRQECTWRAVDAHYNNRYWSDGQFRPYRDRVEFEGLTGGGNQVDGMLLCRGASEILGYKVDQLWQIRKDI